MFVIVCVAGEEWDVGVIGEMDRCCWWWLL